MMPRQFHSWLSVVIFLILTAQACAQMKMSAVPAWNLDGQPLALLAADEASRAGLIEKTGRTLRYGFGRPLVLSAAALELEYEIPIGALLDGYRLMFRAADENAWALPGPADLPEAVGADGVFRLRYRFPLLAEKIEAFSIAIEPYSDEAKPPKVAAAPGLPLFRLRELRLAERAYGFDATVSPLWATPFVYRETIDGGRRLIIDPPAPYRNQRTATLVFRPVASRVSIAVAAQNFVYAGGAAVVPVADVVLGAGLFAADAFPVVCDSAVDLQRIVAASASLPIWPEPISLDPGLIQSYRQSAWRDARFELFRWPTFPSVLIFDTADYALQDRLFKRLAFFVEKAGYIGKLMRDEEIAHLHGWNAHDYRALDLAAFFTAAATAAFPLSAEELELRRILVAESCIVETADGYAVGSGAVISLSRESADYLRAMFMTHEAYHGLFFTDEGFRAFATARWDGLPEVGKTFLKAYFDQNRYDTTNRFLMVNEFMSYCLQQPVSSAAKYFGDTLPSRLEADPRRAAAIGQRDPATGVWPRLAAIFETEAAVFHDYVQRNWGLRAGSANTVYQSSKANDRR